MDRSWLAHDGAPQMSPPPPLEVVAGRAPDPEPLARGLRAVRDLLEATDCVFFGWSADAMTFHAATGAESARLGAQVAGVAADLEARIQGPCTFAPAGVVEEIPSGLALLESPLPGVLVLAERLHRRLAFGLAAGLRTPVLPAAQVGLAHALFRDLVRLLRDRVVERSSQRCKDARWERARFAGLIGASRPMRRLFEGIEKLARSDVNVLLLGESGTGKELVARAIHDSGSFAGRRFVAQNCAALPEALLESELFGHAKGAFTGAQFEKRGLFEEANGGTFFLDEIADMPLSLQIKMLRVLQEGEIRRLGETRTRQVSVRIVAATNKSLAEEVARGRFRVDLFYRLNVVKLDLPPLRRRREDIPLLARYFADTIASRLGRSPLVFSEEAMQRLVDYTWPGNVRELENEIERLLALHSEDDAVRPYMLSERLRYGGGVDLAWDKLDEIRDLNAAIEFLERAAIARSLDRHNWNKSRAAGELGVSRQGLIKKIHRLGLVRPGPGRAAVPDASDDGDLEIETEPDALQPQLPFMAS